MDDHMRLPPPPSYIPFDIIPETILCRLPVKSLLRFRCVCKPWDSLISEDTNFAIKHLSVSPKRQHLLKTSWKIEKELTVMSCPFDSRNLHSILTSEPTLLEYYSPFVSGHCNILIASCDGLLCFAIDQLQAVLYNPSIRKVVALYWSGYDHNTDTYKTQAHSYTLGTNSWKRIKDFPSKFQLTLSQTHGIFVSGTVNWLAYHHSKLSIVSLHLGKESYQEIPPPNYGNPKTLVVMKDCLCLFSQESHHTFIDVWLMKECGNKESWIKFISLPGFSDFKKIECIYDDDNHVLLVSREDGKSKWVVYDIINDTVKSFKIEDSLSMVKLKVYVESLISP